MKIGYLRTDQGDEFASSIFFKFCSEHILVPYSPKQNGVVERRYMIGMNMVKSMLKYKNLVQEL